MNYLEKMDLLKSPAIFKNKIDDKRTKVLKKQKIPLEMNSLIICLCCFQ
jgi:hypothetical protein